MPHLNPTPYAGVLTGPNGTYPYQYRTVSVEHLAALQEEIEQVRRAGQLSDSAIFQSYVSEMKFALPADFPEAQSVIVIAIALPLLVIHFQFNGARIPVAMPPNYYESGLTRKIVVAEIQQNILPEPGHRVDGVDNNFHLKLLAVRSGLGRYGRNNICYVDGMGSFLTLRAYLTDYRFESDHWQAMQMMDLCQKCTICQQHCPGEAIRADRFVIDVKRCMTLYNEVEGTLPDWLPREAHNAFMGCMKCQAPCPANHEAMKHTVQSEDVTEEETRQFVDGNPEEHVIMSVSQKLKIPYLVGSPAMVDLASRNIRAVLQA